MFLQRCKHTLFRATFCYNITLFRATFCYNITLFRASFCFKPNYKTVSALKNKILELSLCRFFCFEKRM